MTNGENYKTAKERRKAYMEYIAKEDSPSVICEFAWLELEAEEEKPMPCPYCGSECKGIDGKKFKPDRNGVRPYTLVRCSQCTYESKCENSIAEAIAAHNRVCKAVAAFKEN